MNETTLRPGTSARMPKLGFGVYQLRGEECARACLAALESGYRHLDSAQLYGNEEDVGRALHQYLQQTNTCREDIFVTTKIGRHGDSEEATYRSALRSVKRITGENGYVDLFLVHRPIERRREVWLALERLLAEGRTRYIGVSNFRIEHIEEMKGYARVWPPAVNQIEIHPWCQQRELATYCQSHGIIVQAYSPLARAKKMSDPVLMRVVQKARRRLLSGTGSGAGAGAGADGMEAGKDVDTKPETVTPAQVLVRWSFQKGFVPLPKSSAPARIVENANVFGFNLDQEEMELLDGLDMGAKGALFPANVS